MHIQKQRSLRLLGAIALLVRARLSRNKKWTLVSSIGLIALLVAGTSGAKFIPSQNDIYSYSMAIAFLIAISSYAYGLFSPESNGVNTSTQL